ncbi:glutathione binding-like protein [Bradyrhizobium sp. CCBAU 45384]|uniref:glutathione binding-like protein n=1 Tax=Bradyrhizobium sp. CCBAU 45384 TaxID=858428 RepID=UPI0023055E03|nr:glutathione binding-like protein [Bradyrhizobium sp. CCBAU 45384]MDA9405434.1 glutathione S-transferase [Bradyrhizobium sp. CCBAU 45384]
MLQLYFSPMACSLASRIALMEAGLEARYHQVHLATKTIADGERDFRGISAKGAVPVLVLENGERLTESAAVLQYIADLKPERGLAPRPGDLDRYRLQEWLSFVGTEIHKAFLFPTFWYKDDGSLAKPRARISQTLSVPSAHLTDREFLVGSSFTVADAHLAWALLLLRPAGVDVAQWPSLARYLERMQARPVVREAIAIEMALRKSVPVNAA